MHGHEIPRLLEVGEYGFEHRGLHRPDDRHEPAALHLRRVSWVIFGDGIVAGIDRSDSARLAGSAKQIHERRRTQRSLGHTTVLIDVLLFSAWHSPSGRRDAPQTVRKLVLQPKLGWVSDLNLLSPPLSRCVVIEDVQDIIGRYHGTEARAVAHALRQLAVVP